MLPLGMALIVSSPTFLILALQWGGSRYAWPSWQILTFLIAFVILLAAFAYSQYRREHKALIPPRILLQRNVLAASLFSSCNNGALSILEYYVSRGRALRLGNSFQAHFATATRLSPDN